MSSIALTYRAINSKIKSVGIFNINWKFVLLIGVVIFGLMLVSYIYLINELTQGSYLIKKYNNKISELSSKNSQLEAQLAQSGFLGKVTLRATELNFIRTGSIKYIKQRLE